MGKVKQHFEDQRRKQINKAAETYLCDQDDGDNCDAYAVLLEESDKGNGDCRAADFVTVWQPLENSVSVDEMIHLIEDGISEPEVPEVLKKIDWTTLRTQKSSLLAAITKAEQTGNNEFVDDLTGILNLIDALQDYAVDEMGVAEMHVYDFELEDKREGYNGDLNTPVTPEIKPPTCKFKVWVEVERIELDDDGKDIAYIDEECPIGIAYRDTLPEAVKLQELIENNFGEIKIL